MSRAIEHVTLGGEDDGRIVLGNAQIAAPLTITSSWARIRIGARLSFEDTGANLTGTPRMYIGMMSTPSASLTNGPLTAATSNFLGFRTAASSWTRGSGSLNGPIVYNWAGGNAWTYIQKVGSTVRTIDNAVGGVNKYVSASTGSWRTALVMEIKKSASGFTGSLVLSNALQTPDVSYSNMVETMEIDDLTGAYNALTGSYASDIAIGILDESSGSFNSICLAWDRTTSKVHISDVLWTQFSS